MGKSNDIIRNRKPEEGSRKQSEALVVQTGSSSLVNSAREAVHSVAGASLLKGDPARHGFMSSCPAGSTKVAAGKGNPVPGTGQTTAGKGHAAAGRGTNVAGKSHTTAGQGVASDWRILMIDFRLANSEEKQDRTEKRIAKYELNGDISMEVLASWGEIPSTRERGSENHFPTWRLLMNDYRLAKNPQPAVFCHFDPSRVLGTGEKSVAAEPGNNRSLSSFGMTARNLKQRQQLIKTTTTHSPFGGAGGGQKINPVSFSCMEGTGTVANNFKRVCL